MWQGFWGVGEGEASEVANDRCQFVTRLDDHGFCVKIVFIKHCSRPKSRNDGRIASLSHCTRDGYKNFLLPPTTERIGGYIEECVFENFKTFGNQGSKCQNQGFGFSHIE